MIRFTVRHRAGAGLRRPFLAWGALVLTSLLILATALPTLGETPSPSQRAHVVLDGQVLPGVTFERAGTETWFPLQDIARAAGLKLTLEADGTVRAGSRTFRATTRTVGGKLLVTRADVKRALNATVFLDPELPRAVITTAGARNRLAQKAATPVEGPSRPAPSTQPRPSRPNAPSPAVPGGPGRLDVSAVELDRATNASNMLRVRAHVRNDGPRPLRGLTVSFVLWVQGGMEVPDALTGDMVSTGKAYSEYPQALGDLAPGEMKSFEVITTVANPDRIETGSRLVVLNMQSAFDSFAVRRLRYGFKARVSAP